jgi:hypothetical protein
MEQPSGARLLSLEAGEVIVPLAKAEERWTCIMPQSFEVSSLFVETI